MSEAAISAGAAAWAAVSKATDFASWKAIATALSIGRQYALRLAKVNGPHGKAYSRAFLTWTAANGFSSMPFGLRAACIRLADNMGQIEEWRQGLSQEERASQNNPQVVLRSWRRSAAAQRRHQEKAQRHIVMGKNGGGKGQGSHRPVCWPQALIQRGADGLKELALGRGSQDFLVMAKRCLDSAVSGLSHTDLEALLFDEPPPRQRRDNQPAGAQVFAPIGPPP
jgi:hypothetical protein